MGVKKAKTIVVVPQSYEAANALLQEYGHLDRQLATEDTAISAKVAALKAEVEAVVAPIKSRQKEIEAQLEAYGAAHRDELTDKGKTKHHDMPAGRIGWRFNPASVAFKKGLKEEDIIAALREMRLARFLRRTFTVNKQAMLDDPDKAITVPGVRIKTGEENFYLAPVIATLSEGEP